MQAKHDEDVEELEKNLNEECEEKSKVKEKKIYTEYQTGMK